MIIPIQGRVNQDDGSYLMYYYDTREKKVVTTEKV